MLTATGLARSVSGGADRLLGGRGDDSLAGDAGGDINASGPMLSDLQAAWTAEMTSFTVAGATIVSTATPSETSR